MREQATPHLIKREAGFVAGRFDAENKWFHSADIVVNP